MIDPYKLIKDQREILSKHLNTLFVCGTEMVLVKNSIEYRWKSKDLEKTFNEGVLAMGYLDTQIPRYPRLGSR